MDFVAHALAGSRFRNLDRGRRAEVRAWFEGPHATAAGGSARAPSRPPSTVPGYPPAGEVGGLWAAARPISRDAEVADYLSSRGVNTPVVELRDMARVLPVSASLPTWARVAGRGWAAGEYRVLVPLWDARGVMRSVLARSIDRAAARKSLAPSGFARGGLVMACPAARRMLAEPESARAWTADAELRVVIAEGEIDTLYAASLYGNTHDAIVLGIFSGGWTETHAARIPDGAVVKIATHRDPPGEHYAAQIVDTFAGRGVALKRWDPSPEAA